MKNLIPLLAAVVLLGASANRAPGQTILKTEAFDSEDSAKTNGWSELGSRANNMAYGYSSGSAYAGGAAAGEAGGKVGRQTIRSMYADVFGSFLTLDSPLTATGRVAIAFQNGNASVIMGHSDSTRIGLNQDSLATIGIRTVPSTFTMEAVIGLTNAVRTMTVVNAKMDVTGLTNYNWSYSWDPSGGAAHAGALTVVVSDYFSGLSSFTNTVTLAITASDRAQNPRFDSFGLTTRSLSASAVFAQTYVDDFSYTALPSCVRVAPLSLLTVPGQMNKTLTVTIPAAANVVKDVSVLITSLNPAVAEPSGATAGALVVNFPAGGDHTQVVGISALSSGSTMLLLSSTNAICFADSAVAVTVAPQTATHDKSENFDSAISARTNGWSEIGTRLNGQDFGYSSSTNAGGTIGEAGGYFKRDSIRSGYADVFGAAATLNDFLHASGTIIVPATPQTNAGPIVGYGDVSKAGSSTEASLMGLETAFTTAGVMEFRARLVLADGTGYEPAGLLSPAAPGTVYYWDFTYDPAGGPTGDGALTVNISDVVSFFTNTAVINLSLSDRVIGARFDSFGIISRALTAADQGTGAFMDNLTYTAAGGVPCARFLGDAAYLVVVGQTNRSGTVFIPAYANSASAFTLRVSSMNPSVAVPAGADVAGNLDIQFPAGGILTSNFSIQALSAGTAMFQISDTAGVCAATNLLVVNVPCSSITASKSESFDSAASASANGWVEMGSRINGQNFGFSATSLAGEAAGEAGGTFKRDATRAAYLDAYHGRLTLNDYIAARGRVIVPGPFTGNLGPNIGHSDSTKSGLSSAVVAGTGAEANNIALDIVSGTSFVPELILADGSRHGEVTFFSGISTNTVYDWFYIYDPTGGPSGYGSLATGIIVGGVTNTGVYNLTANDRAVGAQFDSFGLTSRALASSAAVGPVYIDDVTYTVPMALRIAELAAPDSTHLKMIISSPAPCGNNVIQETADLVSGTWTVVTNVNVSVAMNNQVTAEFSRPSGQARFYRVLLQ